MLLYNYLHLIIKICLTSVERKAKHGSVLTHRRDPEKEVRLPWVQLVNGNQSIPDLGINWDLKDNFNLSGGHLFLDYMVRVQLSRLSGRLYYEVRDFDGIAPFQNIAGQPS